nr:unnamed protein product [Digitaria exilis]
MAQELAVRGAGAGADEEYSAPPWRKQGGVLVRRGAFGVKREVFAVAKMPAPARRLLRKRLISELDAVRDALRKAELVSCGARGGAGEGGQLMAAQAPVGEGGGGRSATRRKMSPSAEQKQSTGEAKRMMMLGGDRERLAGRLASLATVLPDHVVAFLQNQRAIGDYCDYLRGDDDGGGKIEKQDVTKSMNSGVFQLKILLDKFAPEKKSTPKGQEEEDEKGVDICGGVSRIAIRDIAEEYGELVEDIGVKLLSPLQRKYVDLAEKGECYVDICGDASPVVFPTKTTGHSISSSDSDTSSSDSDSSSSSFISDSGSDHDKSARSRSPSPLVPKKIGTCAPPPEPAPVGVQDQRAPSVPTVLPITSSPPAPAVLPPKLPEPAPETLKIAQQEDLQDLCPAAAPKVHLVTGIPSVPSATLPKENDGTYNKQPPLPAREAIQIAEPEEPRRPCVAAAAATVHPIAGGSAPPSTSLPKQNDTSEMAPPVATQVAVPEELHGVVAVPAPGDGITDLVTLAKEETERRRQQAKDRAKAEARRVLVEVERAALRDQRVNRRDMELLGLAAFEHVVSTVQQGARTAEMASQVREGGGLLRVLPGGPSILQQLGVFLKADDGSDDDDEQQAALASHVEDMEVEDGEIR